MPDHPGDLIWMKPGVNGVGDGPHPADRVVGFQMAVSIPGQRADTVALTDPDSFQRTRHLSSPDRTIRPGIAVDIAFHPARNHLDLTMVSSNVLQDR